MMKYSFEVESVKGCFFLHPLSSEIFEEQKSLYYSWMDDENVTKHNSHGLFAKNKVDVEDWLLNCNSQSCCTWALMYATLWVGTISLQNINWVNRSAEVALYIGETRFWGKGVATKMIEKVLLHAFRRLGLHRVWSGTASGNIGMNRVFGKLNFRNEGVFKDGMWVDGKYHDINCWGILSNEFDWMGKRNEG